MKTLIFALALALSPDFLFAVDQQFSFALPEFEGRISLGIYDETGKLVRPLFVDVEEESFQKGLNGLIADWDGRDAEGLLVQKGTYSVRGFLVGDAVQTEGVAFHFNDWVEDDVSPRVGNVVAVVPTEAESFLLCGQGSVGTDDQSGSNEIWRFEESTGLKLLLSLPKGARFLVGDNERVATWENGPVVYNLKSSDQPVRGTSPDPDIRGGAFWRQQLCLGFGTETAGRVEEWDVATCAEGKILAGSESLKGLTALDANGAALMARTTENALWISRGAGFTKAPMEELPEDFSLSAGAGETLWVAGRAADKILVRQYAFDGELLREMQLAGDEFATVELFADQSDRSFFLLLHAPDGKGQSLRGYRSLANGPAPASGQETISVDWEVFLDKSIVPCAQFGWVNGQLVADAGLSSPPDHVRITLPPDTLNAQASELELTAASDASGLWLQSRDGLKLLRLAEQPGWKREILVRDGEDLRVFAGDGLVVAEYRVSGWDQIAPIDAGKIEIP